MKIAVIESVYFNKRLYCVYYYHGILKLVWQFDGPARPVELTLAVFPPCTEQLLDFSYLILFQVYTFVLETVVFTAKQLVIKKYTS